EGGKLDALGFDGFWEERGLGEFILLDGGFVLGHVGIDGLKDRRGGAGLKLGEDWLLGAGGVPFDVVEDGGLSAGELAFADELDGPLAVGGGRSRAFRSGGRAGGTRRRRCAVNVSVVGPVHG